MTARSTPFPSAWLGPAVLAAGIAAGLSASWDGALLVAGITAVGAAGSLWETSAARSTPGPAAFAPVAALVLALAGGIIVTRQALAAGRPLWMYVSGVAVCVLGSVVAGRGRRPLGEPALVLALCVTAAALWACVPETDALERAGAVVAVGGLVALVTRYPIGPALLAAAAALFVYLGWGGGQYRDTAVVGAVGCFGVIVAAAPAVAWSWSRAGTRTRWSAEVRYATVLGAHGAVALVSSRIAGRGDSLGRSVLIVTVSLAALAVGVMVAGLARR